MRKWLRRPTFRQALNSVRATLHYQADFQVSNAASRAARKLCADDTTLSPNDLGRLLRLSHLRQRFATDTDHDPHANSNGAHADAVDESSGLTRQQIAEATGPHPDDAEDYPDDYIPRPTPGCTACALRRINPDWIEHPAAFRRHAFQNGYSSPLQKLPDFPEPEPQDTFYYQLLQDPHALLHYMNLYDQRADKDHRFQPILLSGKHLLPREDPSDLPRFQSQRPKPQQEGR
jgi:hypothetical protein